MFARKNAFDVGDLVRLKSGGPIMTVESVSNNTITCEWFNVDHTEVLEHNFYVAQLDAMVPENDKP